MSSLDVRTFPAGLRHRQVLACFDVLAPGDAVSIVDDHEPKPLLYLLQAERPSCFEWNVLEAGPERWRIDIVRRDALPRRVTEFLVADHERLERLLGSTGRLVAAARYEEAAQRLAELRCGLERHIAMEEEVLFPIAALHSGTSSPVLFDEHREILRLLEELAESIADEDPSFFRGTRAELGELLAEHHRKEDRTIGPQLDLMFEPRERDDLVRRMQAV